MYVCNSAGHSSECVYVCNSTGQSSECMCVAVQARARVCVCMCVTVELVTSMHHIGNNFTGVRESWPGTSPFNG